MPKFMSRHSVPPGSASRGQANQFAQTARTDGTALSYRSFLNLSEGRLICVVKAPNRETLAAWFENMQISCNEITSVELVGQKGSVTEA